MELARRTRWIALSLPVTLAAAAVLARPAPPGVAAAGPMPGRACTPAAAASSDGAPAWYRLDPVLDADGTLAGRGLTVGRGDARWTVALPPESFASGPAAGRVLVGDDDGNRSRLRVLDTVHSCWSELGTQPDVVRSALLAPDGTSLYEHRVDRATRQDLGVWRRELSVTGATARLLPGLDPDAEYGVTYATTLLLADDGRLVVSSCGERACRTRVIGPAAGTVSTVAGTGPAIGLAGGRLVAFDACVGLPCPLRAVDLATGADAPMGAADGPAALAPDGSGRVVLADGTGLLVVSDDAAGGADVRGTSGLAPIVLTSTADSGFEAPPGRVAVAPDGRVDDPAQVRLLDPASLQLSAGEVLP